MGVSEIEYCRCEACDETFEIELFSEIFGFSATLVDSDNPVLVEDISEPEPPDDYVPPHDVHAELARSQNELRELLWMTTGPLMEGTPAPPPEALVRMVFSQLVAVLEAYLADRLHREAIESPKVKLRLVGAKIFDSQTISLKKAIEDPGLVERRFVETIKSVLYHDFDKVENLYKIAFGMRRVFPSDENRNDLVAAVTLRHHCVHRNGKDKDGTPQTISAKDVEAAAEAMRELVEHIEQSIEERRKKDAEPEATPKHGHSPNATAPE